MSKLRGSLGLIGLVAACSGNAVGDPGAASSPMGGLVTSAPPASADREFRGGRHRCWSSRDAALACMDAGQALSLRMRDGHDHSYYFIATFIEEHLRHHAKALVG